VLVLADHSIFINEMMLQKQRDNGNFDFAYSCADWLLTRPSGERGRRNQILFYEDGVVQTEFNIKLKDVPLPPLPPLETLMDKLDETLYGMEQEGAFAKMEEEDDVFNDTIEGVMASMPIWKWASPQEKIWTLVVILMSVILGIYAFLRLGAFRHRHDATGPLLADLLEKQAPAGSVLAERQVALLRDGNLWEAARDLARQLFLSVGASPDASRTAPIIEVRGSWWRRWWMGWRWQSLWRRARSARPVRVSPHHFTRLVKKVRELRAALADGSVRIIG
jgi:hypothetical protein